MIKVLWAVMCMSTHLPSRLECQQRGLNWNTPFILENLTGYRHPVDILIKVLSWFCLERDGEGFLPVSQKLGSGLLKQASEREIIFKVSAGGSFSESLKTWSALPIRFSLSWPCHGWDLVCRLPELYLVCLHLVTLYKLFTVLMHDLFIHKTELTISSPFINTLSITWYIVWIWEGERQGG